MKTTVIDNGKTATLEPLATGSPCVSFSIKLSHSHVGAFESSLNRDRLERGIQVIIPRLSVNKFACILSGKEALLGWEIELALPHELFVAERAYLLGFMLRNTEFHHSAKRNLLAEFLGSDHP